MKIGYFGGKFLPPHNGHLFIIEQILKQIDKLYVGICYNEQLEKELCKNCKLMPVDLRFDWLFSILKNRVTLLKIKSNFNTDDDWRINSLEVLKQIPQQINYTFGSESWYEEYFNKYYPGSTYICIDRNREAFPISSTQIRENPLKYKNFINPIIFNYLS